MNSTSLDCDPISRNDSASNISIQESELSGFKLDSSLSHQKQSTPLNGGFRPMRSAASLFSKFNLFRTLCLLLAISVTGLASAAPIARIASNDYTAGSTGQYVVIQIDDVEAEIIRKNLIGYTTIILPVKSGTVYKSIMGANGTLGIRLPNNNFAQRICEILGRPITTTSVNRSGEIPLNDPNEIFKVFNGEFDLLIDDGKINHTKGSTIYKLENYKLNTIRK